MKDETLLSGYDIYYIFTLLEQYLHSLYDPCATYQI